MLGRFSEPSTEREYESALDEEIDGLLQAYRQTQAEWLAITNEAGLGIVLLSRRDSHI